MPQLSSWQWIALAIAGYFLWKNFGESSPSKGLNLADADEMKTP
jgi:hypothetical protein